MGHFETRDIKSAGKTENASVVLWVKDKQIKWD